LPALSRVEKQDLFAKFVEADKNQFRNVISTFETASAQQANKSGSLKKIFGSFYAEFGFYIQKGINSHLSALWY
jgi:hypothetical protein